MEHLSQFMVNHWVLSLSLFVIIVLIYVNEWFSQKRAPQSLSPQASVEKINHEDAIVIDLRDQEAFSAGHIIHAIRASESDFQLPRMAKYKTKPIILVCSRGTQSQPLAVKLKSQGFLNVMTLSGGFTSWQAAGFPIVKGNK
jgi:rhodanese-related sulfurtransferase